MSSTRQQPYLPHTCFSPSSVSAPPKPLLPINPPPHLKLSNLSEVILKFRNLESPSRCLLVCLPCPPAAGLPSRVPENSGTTLIETPQLPRKRICFVHATESRPACPRGGRGGVIFPISASSAVAVCAPRLCADGPGQPFSNGQGLETGSRTAASSTRRVFLSIYAAVGTVWFASTLLYVWILRSTH